MGYVIRPYKGVGNIIFGMTSEEIEMCVKEHPKKFMKTKDALYTTDKYQDFFVYYKAPGKCEAIEFINHAQVLFQDIPLFQYSYDEAEIMFKGIDAELQIDNDGFVSYKYGVGIYAPYKGDEDAQIESIIVFERGYYN